MASTISTAITPRTCDITDRLFTVMHDIHELFSRGHKSAFIEVLIELQRVIPPITEAHTSIHSVHIPSNLVWQLLAL